MWVARTAIGTPTADSTAGARMRHRALQGHRCVPTDAQRFQRHACPVISCTKLVVGPLLLLSMILGPVCVFASAIDDDVTTLLSLYDATLGPEWFNNVGWSAEPQNRVYPCDPPGWAGVGCDSGSPARVTYVHCWCLSLWCMCTMHTMLVMILVSQVTDVVQ